MRISLIVLFLAPAIANAETFEHLWLTRVKPPPYSGVATSFRDSVGAWGNRINQSQMICAHLLELRGQRLRVTNVDNGLSAVCEVQDRGPDRMKRYWPRREIDLSSAMDRAIGCDGMCNVTIERE